MQVTLVCFDLLAMRKRPGKHHSAICSSGYTASRSHEQNPIYLQLQTSNLHQHHSHEEDINSSKQPGRKRWSLNPGR